MLKTESKEFLVDRVEERLLSQYLEGPNPEHALMDGIFFLNAWREFYLSVSLMPFINSSMEAEKFKTVIRESSRSNFTNFTNLRNEISNLRVVYAYPAYQKELHSACDNLLASLDLLKDT